jgi:hypothetical protein
VSRHLFPTPYRDWNLMIHPSLNLQCWQFGIGVRFYAMFGRWPDEYKAVVYAGPFVVSGGLERTEDSRRHLFYATTTEDELPNA